MRILLYKASYDTLLGKLIAWVDGGSYSHVELILSESDSHYYTVGCHFGRGGVSRASYRKGVQVSVMTIPSKEFEEKIRSRAYSLLERKIPYAVHKLPRTAWSWWPSFGRGMVCSSFVAQCLNLENPDSFGVQDLVELASSEAGQEV